MIACAGLGSISVRSRPAEGKNPVGQKAPRGRVLGRTVGSISVNLGLSRVDLGSISGRSRVDLGSVSGRSQVELGSPREGALGPCWVDLPPRGAFSGRSLVNLMSILGRSRVDLGFISVRSWFDLGSISGRSRVMYVVFASCYGTADYFELLRGSSCPRRIRP